MSRPLSLCAQQPGGVIHRSLLPVLIVLNILLFIWSNSSLGAAVYVRVSLDLYSASVQHAFETYSFSLVCVVYITLYNWVLYTFQRHVKQTCRRDPLILCPLDVLTILLDRCAYIIRSTASNRCGPVVRTHWRSSLLAFLGCGHM